MNRPAAIRTLSYYYANQITLFEAMLMQHFCSFQKISWIKILFILVSRLGDGPLWVITATGLLIGGSTEGRVATIAACVAVLLSVTLFILIKNLTGRPRPFETCPGLTCLMAPPDKFSFPSGHTMTAFTVCSSLSVIMPVMLLPYLTVAILIGLSRVFLGLHYPTDVIVGALLGSLIGYYTGMSALVLQTF